MFINRRQFTVGILSTSLLVSRTEVAVSQNLSQIDMDIAAYSNNADVIERSVKFRELGFRDSKITESQTGMDGPRSDRQIAQSAITLIVNSEVSGKSRYQSHYKRPIWPRGRSGITVGIGYDLGYVRPAAFRQHWAGLLSQQALDYLAPACRLKGTAAQNALKDFQDIEIEWDVANTQFLRFLPYIIAETERAFPNSNLLSDASMGALVSIVYNRGSSIDRNSNRRREMYNIHVHCKNKEFEKIPTEIRRMKRIWENEPDAKGLLERREIEAQLFEVGRR